MCDSVRLLYLLTRERAQPAHAKPGAALLPSSAALRIEALTVRWQLLSQMVELAKKQATPAQKQATLCQSCGLKATTNLRCSSWSAAAPTRELGAPAAMPTSLPPSPSPCPGSKLVNYCSRECQLRGPPPPLPLPPSSCAEELSLHL